VLDRGAGQQRGRGLGAEDREVVEPLGTEPFFAGIGGGQQRGGRDEHQVPAEPEQQQADEVVQEGVADEHTEQHAQAHRGDATEQHAADAEPAHQQRRRQRGQVHAEQVRRDHRGRLAARIAVVHVHADRRRGHDEAHHRVGHEAAEYRDPIGGQLQDLAQRPRALLARGRARRGIAEARQYQRRDRAQPGEHQERAGELRPAAEVARQRADQRRADRRAERAEHHRGDRAAGELGRDELGGGEAVLLDERHVAAEQEATDAEQREAGTRDRPGTEQRGEHRDPGAADHRRASTDALHQQRGGDRRRRDTEHGQRHRQRGEFRQRRDAGADDAAEREQREGAAGREALGDGEDPDVAHATVTPGARGAPE
jgi:hypothetical protein